MNTDQPRHNAAAARRPWRRRPTAITATPAPPTPPGPARQELATFLAVVTNEWAQRHTTRGRREAHK